MTELFEDAEAIHSNHQQVKKDEIRFLRKSQRDGGFPIPCLDHPIALIEDKLQRLEEALVVVDREDRGAVKPGATRGWISVWPFFIHRGTIGADTQSLRHRDPAHQQIRSEERRVGKECR